MFDKQEENQMTYVRIGGSSFSNEDIFAFVVVILVIGIASWIGYYFEIKRQFQATGKSESKNSGKTSTKRKHRMVCS